MAPQNLSNGRRFAMVSVAMMLLPTCCFVRAFCVCALPTKSDPQYDAAAVDERAWRHQQLARSLQSCGSVPGGDADFALALQLALEDEAGAGPAPSAHVGRRLIHSLRMSAGIRLHIMV